ncbi:MAG: FAD-dependent oxidoreductase [Streptosporangiales bacterium]|nr:FAD-dependent oxidoreductase [Streptosporangiales bacterium]
MPYVVTQSCCSDAACVVACPVNAIHPAPGEPGFATTEMLYVDPETCVDCGACAPACPVGALLPDSKLPESQLAFARINAEYYERNPHAGRPPLALVNRDRELPAGPVRVAVIGAGPAGLYAADELLRHRGVSVDVFDRLPTPHGLARYGVAPDHTETRRVLDLFAKIENEAGFRYRLNVEAGNGVTHAELREAYHAVVYATGAATDRSLGLEGEDLPGSVSATDFVAWYNGHPDSGGVSYPLRSSRAVIIGNGNVALDVARVLTADPGKLAATDIAGDALLALRASEIREVLILGRRGPAEAAFTLPELVGLASIEDVDIVVEGDVRVTSEKTEILAELARREPRPGARRIVLRFNTAPVRMLGSDAVTGLEVSATRVTAGRAVLTGSLEVLETGLVLRAIGYRALPVPGLPFDEERAVVPSDGGRVEPGVYVTGWIKRGPTGFLGTNKSCAKETVGRLLDDLGDGVLSEPTTTLERRDGEISGRQWRAIDAAARSEQVAGPGVRRQHDSLVRPVRRQHDPDRLGEKLRKLLR